MHSYHESSRISKRTFFFLKMKIGSPQAALLQRRVDDEP
jgi:hypothetical protein